MEAEIGFPVHRVLLAYLEHRVESALMGDCDGDVEEFKLFHISADREAEARWRGGSIGTAYWCETSKG